MKTYLDFSEYLKRIFSEKVQKISINASLSCPNRDGVNGLKGGCAYCNNRSFSPDYTLHKKSVSEQLNEGIRFFSRKYQNMKYIAYFQSYTNTYGNLDQLIALYEEALSHPEVKGLFVGTRPDCISDELLGYFSDLSSRTKVFLEYGVESTLDSTLITVNRGHDFQTSVNAILRTQEMGLPCGVHLIIGLPNERETDYLTHINRLNKLPITSIKFHQLQILKGTSLGRDYLQNPDSFHLFSLDEYLHTAILLIRHLRPDIYIDRFTSQSPKDLLIAPKWEIKNYQFTDKLIHLMHELGAVQGDLYGK